MVVLFGLVSQFGDVWFLFLLGGVLYVAGEYAPRWRLDRRRGLFVFALVLTHVAFIGLLKGFFVLPRPPGAADPVAVGSVPPPLGTVVGDVTTATGPGFPSGHALGTTMVWGGLALSMERWSVRLQAGVVGTVVGLVSLSRLVLGVHYLVDVVVGAALGLVVLWVIYGLSDAGTDPGRVLGVAVAFGALGLVQHATIDSAAALGGAVGGWLVWRLTARSVKPHPSNWREVLVGFGILAAAGVFFGAVYALELPFPATFAATALAVGAVVGAPLVGERLM